jgi:hypothetical protein
VPTEKIVLDKVTVNPKFADSLFTKPEVTAAANTVKKPAHVNN